MGLFSKLFNFRQAVQTVPQTSPNVPQGTLEKATTEPYPGNAPIPAPRTAQSGSVNYYEALNESENRTAIPLYALALKSVLQSFTRTRLAFLGRYLYDNDGQVGYAVDQIANYSVPIIPMAATQDAAANQLYEDYFDQWCKRADYTGRFSFAGLQRMACKALDQDGDILPVMTARHGFPQVQMFETWRVDSSAISDTQVLHVDGVRVDAEGVVLGYYTVSPKPDLLPILLRGLTPDFTPASQAFLLYDPDRFSAYRGVSPIRRGMNDVRDAKDIKGFEKTATKIAAALAAVIEGADLEEPDVWGSDTGNEDLGGTDPGNEPPADATPQEKKISKAELLGGDIPVLPEGRKLNQLQNNRPGERVMELLEYLGGSFIAGLGVPPAFFQAKKMTGPNQRGVNGQAQRKFDQRQDMLAAWVEWVWVRVIAWGIAHDGLPAVPGWDKIEWQGPPKVSIDDGADAAAWREDVQSGLMTRQEHYANRARNWQRETDQGFVEDDYILTKANELAVKQNVAVEIILAKWGYTQAKPSAPKPAPGDNQTQNDNAPENQTQNN